MSEDFKENKDIVGRSSQDEDPDMAALNEARNPKQPFSKKVLEESAWLFGSYALSRVGRIAMMLAIAALLSPTDYGLIGLTTVILTIVQIINEFGVWQAVVHRQDPDDRFLNTAFWTNVAGGLLNSAMLFLIAPWIAGFYGEPEMTALFRIMALSLIVDGFYYVPDGLLRKELRFKSRALPEIASTLVVGVTTIALILWGLGVQSYAVGLVVGPVVMCVMTFRRIAWRPGIRVSWTYLKEILSYSRHIFGADLARHVSSNVDYLIVGRILGAAPLGFYTLAFNLANYPVSNFAYILSRIAFPTFAALQEDPAYARRVYLRMVQVVAVIVIPILVLLALLANLFVVGVLGDKWQPAVFVLQVMVVAGVSRAISMPGFDMLRAIGFPNVPFRVNLAESVIMVIMLLLVADRGIGVVALVVTAIMSLFSWATTLATCLAFGIRVRSLMRVLVPAVVLAASGAGAVLLLRFLDFDFGSEVVELAASVAVAGAAMSLCLATALRSLSRDIIRLVTSRGSG